jgi:hypothetical protein
MRAGSAPRAPRWDGAPPPDHLHVMSVAGRMHRHMPSLYRELEHRCQLHSARKHARPTISIRRHRIRVPRDAVPGRGAQSPLAARRAGDRKINDNLVIGEWRGRHLFVICMVDTYAWAAHTSAPASYHALLPYPSTPACNLTASSIACTPPGDKNRSLTARLAASCAERTDSCLLL